MSARDDRYNRSSKGQARNRTYEARHPERAQRARTGFVARDAEKRQGTPAGWTPEQVAALERAFTPSRPANGRPR